MFFINEVVSQRNAFGGSLCDVTQRSALRGSVLAACGAILMMFGNIGNAHHLPGHLSLDAALRLSPEKARSIVFNNLTGHYDDGWFFRRQYGGYAGISVAYEDVARNSNLQLLTHASSSIYVNTGTVARWTTNGLDAMVEIGREARNTVGSRQHVVYDRSRNILLWSTEQGINVRQEASKYRFAGLAIPESAITLTPFTPSTDPNYTQALYETELANRLAAIKAHRDNVTNRWLMVDGHGKLVTPTSVATHNDNVAIGKSSNSSGGAFTYVKNPLGTNRASIYDTDNNGSVAIGANSKASGGGGTAIGFRSKATALGSVALGYRSSASAQSGIAIGLHSNVTAGWGAAVGVHSNVGHQYSTAIGYGAKTDSRFQIVLGRKEGSVNSYRLAGLGCTARDCLKRNKGIVLVGSHGDLSVRSTSTDGYVKLKADGTVEVQTISQLRQAIRQAGGLSGNTNPPVTPPANEGVGAGGNSGGTVANTLGSASFGTGSAGLSSAVGDAAAFTDFSAKVDNNVAAISAQNSRITAMEQRLTERADNMEQRLTERADNNAQGVALSNALASLPKALLPGERLRLGIGVGSFDGKSGTAIGIMGKFGASTLLNAGFSTGGGESSTQVGISWGW